MLPAFEKQKDGSPRMRCQLKRRLENLLPDPYKPDPILFLSTWQRAAVGQNKKKNDRNSTGRAQSLATWSLCPGKQELARTNHRALKQKGETVGTATAFSHRTAAVQSTRLTAK